MLVSLIAAIGRNNVIGTDNKLPWHLPADMKRFVHITTGKPIIMGRKTHESIGKTLPDRVNIVVTRDSGYKAPSCVVAHSVDEALEAAKEDREVVVIGGASVYRQFMPYVRKMYLTMVDGDFEGDVYFPEFDRKEWKETEKERHRKDEKNQYDYTFVTLERIQ